ncbi:MAG: hypothetical protein ACRD8Z_09275 [Nitrososphaeraceae archaeon]
MHDLMDKLKVENEKMNVELEKLCGDYEKMILVFRKRFELHNQFLNGDNLAPRISSPGFTTFRLGNKE